MHELMEEIDTVYKMISTVPVTGDNIDTMAAARSKLRKIYAGLTKIEVDATIVKKEEPTEEV